MTRDASEEKANTHYETLGLEKSCTQKDITVAYRKLARKLHPDKLKDTQGKKRVPTEEDNAKWIALKEAYEVLSDEEQRKLYDVDQDMDQVFSELRKTPDGFKSDAGENMDAEQQTTEPEHQNTEQSTWEYIFIFFNNVPSRFYQSSPPNSTYTVTEPLKKVIQSLQEYIDDYMNDMRDAYVKIQMLTEDHKDETILEKGQQHMTYYLKMGAANGTVMRNVLDWLSNKFGFTKGVEQTSGKPDDENVAPPDNRSEPDNTPDGFHP